MFLGSESLKMFEDVLFSPTRLGAIHLANRIVMAPLTRMRSGPSHVPAAMNAEYYVQRSSAGLILTEGTAISPQAHGYPNAPGIYTPDQIGGCAGSPMPSTRAAVGSSCKSRTTDGTRTRPSCRTGNSLSRPRQSLSRFPP